MPESSGGLGSGEETPAPSWPLLAVTAVNLVFAGVMVGNCVMIAVALFVPGFAAVITPGAFFGALLVAPAGFFFCVVLWAAVFGRRAWATAAMPFFYLAGAMFCVLALALNVLESLASENGVDHQFLLWFCLIGGAITAYLDLAAGLALRWRRRLHDPCAALATRAGKPGAPRQTS